MRLEECVENRLRVPVRDVPVVLCVHDQQRYLQALQPNDDYQHSGGNEKVGWVETYCDLGESFEAVD